jgi:hypothetical protein
MYYGQYGKFEMILSLTTKVSHHFYRLSLWLLTGSICGPLTTGGASAQQGDDIRGSLDVFLLIYQNVCFDALAGLIQRAKPIQNQPTAPIEDPKVRVD